MAKENYIGGWIKLYRSSFDNKMYFSQQFTKWQAWCDLLLIANHRQGSFRIRGIDIQVKRGQIAFSVVKLAERWKWSRGKVIRFLEELEISYQIVQQTTFQLVKNTPKQTVQQTVQQNGTKMVQQTVQQNNEQTVQQTVQQNSNITTLISIVNYNKYQDDDTTNDTTNNSTDGTANGTTDGTTKWNENGTTTKEYKELNTIINNSGCVPPPPPPEFNMPIAALFFVSTDFNGLPQKWNDDVVRFIKVTKKIEVEKDDVDSLWDIFKNQHLDGSKPYESREGVYRHFFNTAKKQSFRKATKPRARKTNEKIFGVEFVNDFKECKMSDGSIQKLDINQQDGAKFNLINPNAIVKN